MKIGYYIHHSSLQAGGIFVYSIAVFKMLLAAPEIEKLVLIISEDQKKYFQTYLDEPKLDVIVINHKRFLNSLKIALQYFFYDTYTIYKDYLKDPAKLNFLKRISIFLNPYKKITKSSKIDILHIPVQFAPIYGSEIPIIITMHDLQEFHYPEYFDSTERLHRALNRKKAIEESDHVIVTYNHIKNDIIKYFALSEEDVSVCPPSFIADWFLSKEFTSIEELIEKYQIENKFILYPAATWKHKNHLRLIHSFDILIKKGLNLQLICTGNKTKYFSVLEDEISKRNSSDKIKFLGIIPEEDLIGLYKSTSLVVIPTLYEAGSGPLYEAMKYSAPVICSNVTSLPDAIGNDEFLFDPENENEIASKIEIMIKDENARSRNIKNSVERMNYFKEKNYTENFISVYKKLLNKNS